MKAWFCVEDLQAMTSLVSTSHLQLAAFAFSTVGWILGVISMGIVEWRVWYVNNTTIISSGIAWVGIWKVCFITYLHASAGRKEQFCQKFTDFETFVPKEIFVAQALLLVAMVVGAIGIASTGCALNHIYKGNFYRTRIVRYFLMGGFLYIFAGICVLLPVSWNFYSVVHNENITFPSSFNMPPTAQQQKVGAALPLGIISAILLLMSGTFSLSYRFPVSPDARNENRNLAMGP